MGAWRVRLVTHPLTVVSVVVLALNDAWFKAWWPGLVTGKLSDVAGVWMVAALAIAATGSVRWGSALTALGFTLLKTVSSVAVLTAPVLGGVTLRDPTDLMALLTLWPLGRLARWLGAQRSARVNDAWSTIAAVLVVGGAVFATSATSDDSRVGVDDVAVTTDGRIVARLREEWWVFSGDHAVGTVPESRVAVEQPTCLDDRCFEVDAAGVTADGLRVFEWTEDQREQISWREGDSGGSFLDLVTRETADGGEVWVAVGAQGVLMRRADGTWHQLPVDTARPYEFTDSAWHQHLWLTPLLLAVALPVVLLVFRRRRRWPSVGVVIAAHGCNLAVGLWALVTHPSDSLLATSQLPPEFGRNVFWWTIAAQVPWVFAMVMARLDRHVNGLPAVDQGE